MRQGSESLGRGRGGAIDRRRADLLLSHYREIIAVYRGEFDLDEWSFVRGLCANVGAASDALRLSDDAVIANSPISFLREDGLRG
jgi:hypothetical protein